MKSVPPINRVFYYWNIYNTKNCYNGNYFINVGEESLPIDLDELKRKSEVIFKANPEIEVVFQSDRNVAFDFVAKAMASVQSVGITKVGIVTSGYEN